MILVTLEIHTHISSHLLLEQLLFNSRVCLQLAL